MRKLLLIYLPIILLTLILSAPFLIPAKLVWRLLHPELAQRSPSIEQLALSAFDGTLYYGSATLAWRNIEVGRLTWETDWQLLDTVLVVNGTLRGQGNDLSLMLRLSEDLLDIDDLNGVVTLASLNPYTRPLGLTIDGSLQLDNVSTRLTNRWPEHLSGTVTWSGGNVQYQVPGARAFYRLPELTGDLALNPERAIAVQVEASNTGLPVLQAALRQDGWAILSIRRRFFDLAEKDWMPLESADDIALELEQQIWRAAAN